MSIWGNEKNSSLCHAKLQDERQLAWDQREVELERQLDQYEKHQSEILSSAEKVNYCLQQQQLNMIIKKNRIGLSLTIFLVVFSTRMVQDLSQTRVYLLLTS